MFRDSYVGSGVLVYFYASLKHNLVHSKGSVGIGEQIDVFTSLYEAVVTVGTLPRSCAHPPYNVLSIQIGIHSDFKKYCPILLASCWHEKELKIVFESKRRASNADEKGMRSGSTRATLHDL